MRQRLGLVLDDGIGQVRAELAPFAKAMLTMTGPEGGLAWLAQPTVPENLHLLATGQVAISHDGLNTLRPWRSVAYLRDLLMECGVLPKVDRYMVQFERWLAEWLARIQDPGHRKVLYRFAAWELRRQLRADCERKPLILERINTDRALLRGSAGFLAWLTARGLTLGECGQAHLDAWFAENRHRAWLTNSVIPFLRWCMDQHLMTRLRIARVRSENPAPISQNERIALIRRVLTAEDFPLPERVVALLVLLYAQPISRIVQLRVHDIIQYDARVSIRLGDPPSPVPEPFAGLLLRLLNARPSMTTATNQASPWLLPRRRAGRPVEANTIRKRIRAAGILNLRARTATLRQLVLQAPAPVVAGMLGFHPVHTAFVTRQAGKDWSSYAASGQKPNP